MFWKKNKITNDAFGEIKDYGIGWKTVEKRSFTLFGKTYLVCFMAVANTDSNETINELQEAALASFKDLIVSKKSEIEEVIVSYFERVSGIVDYNCRYREGYDLSDIPSRFLPDDIEISEEDALRAQLSEKDAYWVIIDNQ
jgi:hypothetical protein